MNDLITTTEAANIAGVSVSSIKRWADQAVIQVVRTPGGHRRVIKTSLLRFLQGAGSPSDPPEQEDFTRKNHGLTAVARSRPSPTTPGSYWAEEFLNHDEYEIQASLLEARSRLGSWFRVSDEACLGLLEIGLRWQRGELPVVDEHVASERLHRALATIAQAMPSSSEDRVCVLACLGKESHTLGLSFLQVCILEAGRRPLWVGANTPVEQLCEMVLSQDLNMIAVSASEAAKDRTELSSIAAQLGKACSEARTHLVFGGAGAWPDVPKHGFRLHSFEELNTFLQGLEA